MSGITARVLSTKHKICVIRTFYPCSHPLPRLICQSALASVLFWAATVAHIMLARKQREDIS